MVTKKEKGELRIGWGMRLTPLRICIWRDYRIILSHRKTVCLNESSFLLNLIFFFNNFIFPKKKIFLILQK